MKTAGRDLGQVLRALKEDGLLLQVDARLPNVASLVAGEIVKGSWWSHPRGKKIFFILNQLEDNKDVLFVRLISGKITLVHRKLWRDLLSIVHSAQKWQTDGLSLAAKSLFGQVNQAGNIRSDKITLNAKFKPTKIGDAVRELENRLLIHSGQFHTETGAHAKLLETWPHWAQRVKFDSELKTLLESKRTLEKLVANLNDKYGSNGRLPWEIGSDKRT